MKRVVSTSSSGDEDAVEIELNWETRWRAGHVIHHRNLSLTC